MEQQLLTEILPLILKIFPYSSSVSIQKMQPKGLFVISSLGILWYGAMGHESVLG